jgi:hypothetical protein
MKILLLLRVLRVRVDLERILRLERHRTVYTFIRKPVLVRLQMIMHGILILLKLSAVLTDIFTRGIFQVFVNHIVQIWPTGQPSSNFFLRQRTEK